jgi:hypothetical protein
MKVALIALGLWSLAATSAAPSFLQTPSQTPPRSPRQTAHATVDGCDFTIEYGAPLKRGREIWGALVKWDHWWMPGADTATSVVTTKPIVLDNTLTVPAGTHTLYTMPGDEKFTLIISKDVGQFHTVYHPNRNLGEVPMMKTAVSPPVESLTFAVEPREGGGGVFKLIWDDRAYVTPFVVKP